MTPPWRLPGFRWEVYQMEPIENSHTTPVLAATGETSPTLSSLGQIRLLPSLASHNCSEGLAGPSICPLMSCPVAVQGVAFPDPRRRPSLPSLPIYMIQPTGKEQRSSWTPVPI